MEGRGESVWSSLDWWTIGIYLILVICGYFSIYGASYNFDDKPFYDFSVRYGKQLVWICCATVIALFLLLLDARMYSMLAYIIYASFLLLLILTIFLAPEIKGSRSWLVIGPLSVQPAEFAKTATCLALAKFMSSYGFNMSDITSFLKAVAVILVPMVLIVCQKETGSALAYSALFLVLYRQGMTGLILLLGVSAVVYFIVAIKFGEIPIIETQPDESYGMFVVTILAIIITLCMIKFYINDNKSIQLILLASVCLFGICYSLYKFMDINIKFSLVAYAIAGLTALVLLFRTVSLRSLKPLGIALFLGGSIAFGNISDYAFDNILQAHQQTRIKVTLGMEDDLKGSGYNVNQSMIAIGSGQMHGKGFLNGTQTKLSYVPEQDTDFIFCTVGEEQGFIGTSFVILMFMTLMLRLVFLAERQRSVFSRIYGYCVASIFFFHLAINIGMVIGLTPVIGIPLPFFSYGGSSLWSFTILLFIFLRMDASRKDYMAE